MAVSEMEKLSIIGPISLQETVLQVIQGQRAVELINAKETFADELTTETTEIDGTEDQEAMNYTSLLKRLETISDFLKRYSSDKVQSVLKRKNMTMDELEASYNETELLQELETIEEIKTRFEDLGRTREDIRKERSEFARWQYLDVIPKNTDLKETEMTIGVLNNQNKAVFENSLKQIPDLYKEEVYNSTHHIYYFLLYMKESHYQVRGILEKSGFKTVDYAYDISPKEKYQELQKREDEIHEERKELKQQLIPYAKQLEKFALAEEVVLAYMQRQKAQTLVGESKELFAIDGWVPVDEKEEFLQALYKKVPKDNVVVEFTKPVKGEEVPVRLKNNALVAPFELLTEMYSLPKYGEVDPTPLMTPFYLVFFGMMVADLGYGLVMLLGTIIAKKFMVLKRGMERFVDFFFILSFPVMIWGLIYGSFFGASLPKPFPLLSTSTDVNTILLLSVVFGFIQIIFGLLVNGVMLVREKEYLNAVRDGFAWQGLLIGIVIALVGKMFIKSDILFYSGVIVAVLCALSIVAIPVFQSKSKGKGLAKGMYGLYGLTSYIGDLVSYTRLMALGISGGSIAAAFNMLVGYMPGIARFTIGIVLIVALQLLNLFLSLLSAYVHGARLQYVEFFGKFLVLR